LNAALEYHAAGFAGDLAAWRSKEEPVSLNAILKVRA
jgi:hypothetical protein